jgi:hypothetical protein
MTTSGREPATLRFLAKCLNLLLHRLPLRDTEIEISMNVHAVDLINSVVLHSSENNNSAQFLCLSVCQQREAYNWGKLYLSKTRTTLKSRLGIKHQIPRQYR